MTEEWASGICRKLRNTISVLYFKTSVYRYFGPVDKTPKSLMIPICDRSLCLALKGAKHSDLNQIRFRTTCETRAIAIRKERVATGVSPRLAKPEAAYRVDAIDFPPQLWYPRSNIHFVDPGIVFVVVVLIRH